MKTYRLYLEDILKAMNKIGNYIHGVRYEDFVDSDIIIDAVIRNFEVIGEASKNVPQDIQNEHSHIPWKRMIGLRNIMIHQYSDVDLSIIWKIATENIPETKPLIEKLLEQYLNSGL